MNAYSQCVSSITDKKTTLYYVNDTEYTQLLHYTEPESYKRYKVIKRIETDNAIYEYLDNTGLKTDDVNTADIASKVLVVKNIHSYNDIVICSEMYVNISSGLKVPIKTNQLIIPSNRVGVIYDVKKSVLTKFNELPLTVEFETVCTYNQVCVDYEEPYLINNVSTNSNYVPTIHEEREVKQEKEPEQEPVQPRESLQDIETASPTKASIPVADHDTIAVASRDATTERVSSEYNEAALRRLRRGIETTSESNRMLLMYACFVNHIAKVRGLLAAGVDVNITDKYGQTPLYIACGTGNIEIATLLLDYGANVNQAMECGSTPIQAACKYGHINVVSLLIDRGANY